MPLRTFTYAWDITLYGNILSQIPYIYIKIPELTSNYSSTSNEIREAFSVLVPEIRGDINLNYNHSSFISFVPINDDVYNYSPPLNNLNILTINVFFPPIFLYSPPVMGDFNKKRLCC